MSCESSDRPSGAGQMADITRESEVYRIAKSLFLGDANRIPDFRRDGDSLVPIHLAEGARVSAEQFVDEMERFGATPWKPKETRAKSEGSGQHVVFKDGLLVVFTCPGCKTETRAWRPVNSPRLDISASCGCGWCMRAQLGR